MKRTLARTLLVIAACVLSLAWIAPVGVAGHTERGPNPFADMRGVRWKPGQARRDVLITKAPYAGLRDNATVEERAAAEREVAQRVHANLGATAATIDVSPYTKVWKSIHAQGMCKGTTPPKRSTMTDKCDREIRDWKEAQYQEIARFLENVVGSGSIPEDFKFYLHSRVNNPGEFVTDMVESIAAVQAAEQDSSLAGIMIGEHERHRPLARGGKGYLQLAIDIAERVNERTEGWLRANDRALTLHGARFGADFNHIKKAIQDFDFFDKVSGEARFFAFTFKYFLGEENHPYDTPSPIQSEPSEEQKEQKIQEWMEFFGKPDSSKTPKIDGLHLDGLATSLREHRVGDEHLAPYTNVVFVGDSADGLFAIHTKGNEDDPDGPLINEALIRVFLDYQETQESDGITDVWRAFMFDQPLDHRDQKSSLERGIWGGEPREPQRPCQWWEEWSDRVNRLNPAEPCREY